MADKKIPVEPPLVTRSIQNLLSVLWVWRVPKRDRIIHGGIGDFLVPALLLLLVQSLSYRVLQPNALLNIQVLQNFAGGTALALVALAVVMVLLRQSASVWQVVIGVLWALIMGNLISLGALLVSDPTSLSDWMIRRFGITYVVALMFLMFRLGWRGAGAFAGLILPTTLIALPWFATVSAPPPAAETTFFDPDVEMIYAAQGDLLAAQTQALRPGIAGKTELFAVLGAGYPFEGVFRREVEAVGVLLSDRFGAQDRIISLVNDETDLTSYPLMNRVNLRASLRAVSNAMNPEDIALLFITSHGSPGSLSTNFYEVITRDISPSDVNAALEEAKIGNAIIILPACYSGSFAESLAAPNRLILTGTDADNVSFGCNDQNEWTAWAQAFFVDALAQTSDFRQAALLTQTIIANREAEEGLPPSLPQILEGDAIGRILDSWRADLD